jgi:hypothetical protein
MPRSTEEQAIASRRGKWSDAGVPHKGWNCIEIEDLGAPDSVCEMCEAQPIRFVHHMQHTEYNETLACGCVCAGNMEQDLVAARQRDESMRSRAAKRTRWLTRRWKISAKGNEWLEADGFRVTIFERGHRWAAAVVAVGGSFKHFSRRTYPTENQAKLAAFDLITRLLQARESGRA